MVAKAAGLFGGSWWVGGKGLKKRSLKSQKPWVLPWKPIVLPGKKHGFPLFVYEVLVGSLQKHSNRQQGSCLVTVIFPQKGWYKRR